MQLEAFDEMGPMGRFDAIAEAHPELFEAPLPVVTDDDRAAIAAITGRYPDLAERLAGEDRPGADDVSAVLDRMNSTVLRGGWPSLAAVVEVAERWTAPGDLVAE